MTIEDLAKITYRGFQGSDKRFDKVERQLSELTEALTDFIKATNDNFRHVNARLDRAREDISDVPTIREELRNVTARLERLERKV